MFLFPEPNLLMSPGNFDGVLKHREQKCNQCMATKNLQDHNCHVTTCFNCKMHAIMTDTIKYQYQGCEYCQIIELHEGFYKYGDGLSQSEIRGGYQL